MRPPFRLNKTIGEAYDMDLADALTAKQALADLGHLETPEDGFDEYPDRPLIEAVKSFQRAEGLVEDGVMKPDGPTLARLNETLKTLPPPGGEIGSKSLLPPAPEPSTPLGRHLASLPSRPGAAPPMNSKRSAPDGVQVAMGPAAALIPPLIGVAARTLLGQAARTATGAAAAGAAGALIADQAKPDKHDTATKRTDIAPAFPPPPGYEPPDMQLPDLTEPATEPIELPDLSQPIPETATPTVYVLPAPKPGEFGDGIVERKGNEATRKELERVRDYFRAKGWKHIAGGRFGVGDPALSEPGSTRKPGDERSEHHVPGHFGSLKGGHFTDLTFEMPDGRKVHVQSVDVDRNGKPTQRELDNAEKIRRAEKNTDVILIPKGAQLERLKRSFPRR